MDKSRKTRNVSVLLAAGLTVVTLSACGQQSQTSGSSGSSDDSQDDQQETVIVYRDATEQQDGSNDSGSSANSETSTASASSTPSASTDDDADDNMQQTSELPQGFPVPVANDHEVVRVGETTNELAVDLQVPDGQAAYDYYTQTLESEGFTIDETDVDNDSSDFDADIDFQNADFDGNIDFSGTNVEIDVERQNTNGSSGDTSSGGSTEVPGDFPVSVPGDYEVQNVRVGGDDADDEGDVTLTLNVPDGQAAYDYYVQNLESEGFRVEETEIDNDSGQFEGDIDFDGDNYDGNIDVSGNIVEIDIDRRN